MGMNQMIVLEARRDAQAWTQLCAADQQAVPQTTFVSAWRRQRAKYGAVIDEFVMGLRIAMFASGSRTLGDLLAAVARGGQHVACP